MLKLGIRVANSINSGRGHFERCFSISNHISQKIIWFLDYESDFFESRIAKKDEIFYEEKNNDLKLVNSCIKNQKINFLLLDSYIFSKETINNLAKKIPLCLFQDKKDNYNIQMVICPHPIVLEVSNNQVCLNGPKFSPISNKLMIDNKKNKNDNKNILISMGAYDSLGVTLNVMKAIDNIAKRIKTNIKTTIVLANGSPIIEEVNLFIKNSINFKLLVNVKDMSKIYNNNTIAIGAPGLSHLERLYIGLPTILIAQNKIHELLVEKWVHLNCALKSKNTISMIEKTICYIIESKKVRNELIRNGRKQVDGKGSIRIAKSILMYNKKYD